MNEFFYGTLPEDTQDFTQVLRGVRRSLGDVARGVSYYPYDLIGAPVDIINMALTPMGLGSQQPVMGSDYLRNIGKSLGLAQDPTGSIPETVSRIGAGFINPAAGARAVGQIPQAITRGANVSADKLVQMITGNPQATAQGALQAAGEMAPLARMFKPEQVKSVLPKTKVVDEEGNPKLLYHGTNKEFDDFSESFSGAKTGNPTSKLGFFFSDSPVEASRYTTDWGKEGGNVRPVYLDIKNPKRLTYKQMNDISMALFDESSSLPVNAWKTKEGQAAIEASAIAGQKRANKMAMDLRQQLIDEGYDGAVVKIGGKDEYIAFYPNQIKSATSDPAFTGLLEPQAMAPRVSDPPPLPRESFVEGVPAGQELIVHHNISPEKLSKVQKVGGMPVPSIAISNVERPLTGFGDISLIGSPSMANPSAKNPVYGFDAYTARAPRITYKFDSKSEKNLANVFSDVKNDVKTTGVYDLVDNWDSREFNDLMRAKFLKEKGALPNPSDFKDKWDFSRAIQVATDANYPEYRAWVRDFDSRLADAGVNIQEKIFKGFTPSGNRKYVEANLENLVKEMKGGAGSEGINYGVGNLRAVATPKFKKIDDIKASRGKIVPSEEFQEIKKSITDAYSDLSDRIAKLSDQEGYGYRPEDVLYDIGQAKNVNLLDRFKVGADDELKVDIGIFIRKLQKLPTEYFEIKPQRAVQVSEFEGAIVPADAPESSVNYLRDQGIERIYFYSTPEERTELFKKFGDKMFSATPAVGAGLLGAGMYQDEQMY